MVDGRYSQGCEVARGLEFFVEHNSHILSLAFSSSGGRLSFPLRLRLRSPQTEQYARLFVF